MGNENILIFQKPFMFISIHFFLLWLSQEREETWRKRGTGVLGCHATHQPCLSRSAQLQGKTVRCRVYLGSATSWPEVHSLFHAEMNVPNPGSAPRPALGREWGSVLPRLAKTSAKMLQKAQLEPRALLYPPHSTSGLSGESEGWFNFHPGSPHVWGCQMWQITRVGIWCEVLSAGSGLTVAFHLTCLRWTWNQGPKAWILTIETPTQPINPSVKGTSC